MQPDTIYNLPQSQQYMLSQAHHQSPMHHSENQNVYTQNQYRLEQLRTVNSYDQVQAQYKSIAQRFPTNSSIQISRFTEDENDENDECDYFQRD